MLIEYALLIVGGYLLGSIPTAYLVSRWLSGKDIRQYGSGTVSGSMVYEHVARWAVIPVGLFDIAKAAFPVWIGYQLGLGLPVAAAAGLAATLGHNWPIYLHFTGGRGLSCFIGIWLIVFPMAIPWMGGLLAIGWLLGDSAPFALASLLALPWFSVMLGGPPIVGPVTIIMVLITLAKRIEANRRPLPAAGAERWRVVLRRLFLDRDITSHEDWIRREP